MVIQSGWVDRQFADENIEWVQQKFSYLQSITRGSCVNFPYSGLTDYEEAYYGGNAGRLKK